MLEYDLTSGDTFANRIPDHVLGQTNFYSNGASVTQSTLNNPHGLAYDSVNDRLFVADRENQRVLVFDTSSITDGENASHVLGQTDFVTGGFGSASQSTFSRPEQLAIDTAHSRLFVADSGNGRVMVFDTSSITDGQNATHVIGKPDFTTTSGGVNQSNITEDFGIAYDSVNDRIFVSDFLDNRVIDYDTSSITDGENGLNILGQADYTTTATATTQNGLNEPAGLAYDSSGSRLFVTDAGNARVLEFDVSAITDDENADHVLGQVDFVSGVKAVSQSGLSNPVGAMYDSVSGRLYITDRDTNRVVIYSVSSITDGENAVDELGSTDDNDCSPGPAYDKALLTNFFFFSFYNPDNVPNDYGMRNPSSIAFDTVHHRLFVGDSATSGNTTYNRVLVYSLATDNTLTSRKPNYVLGQPDFHTVNTTASQTTLTSVDGLAYDSVHDRLFVSDFVSQRVLVYDTSSVSNGQAAANVLGQTDFVSTSGGTTQNQFQNPAGLAYDGTHNILYVADQNNSRVLSFDVSTITDGENAAHVLGQPDFVTSGGNLTQNGLSSPFGLAYDGTHSLLFVADNGNSRVLSFDTSAISDNENATHVLGQPDFVTSGGNTTQNGLSSPMGLAMDTSGNRLFVNDSGNNRTVVFDISSITDNQNAIHVIGQSDFVSGGSNGGQAGLNNPQGVVFDPSNSRVYVTDASNNRVMIFDASGGGGGGGGGGGTTLHNQVILSRLQVSVTATATIIFDVQGTTSGSLTVTFPAGFTVLTDPTSGASSGCLSAFGHTSNTFTATKTSCTGTVTLGGGTVTNPSTPGTYVISWGTGDSGSAAVDIVTADQVNVTGAVDPSLSFNVGSQTGTCDGTFTGNGGTVALGTLTTAAVSTSDVSSVPHICTRVSSNAAGGVAVTIQSVHGALASVSAPSNTIASSTATLTAGTIGYGVCAGSGGSDSGEDSTTPTSAAPAFSSPFNSTCTTSAHNVGGLTTSPQTIWTLSAPSADAFVRIYVKAAISPTTVAHNDYSDTLIFVATGTF